MPHFAFEKLPREDLCARIKPYAAALTKSANDGNPRAKEVISLYRMHVNCPSDPGARGLCAAAFDQWLKETRRAA